MAKLKLPQDWQQAIAKSPALDQIRWLFKKLKDKPDTLKKLLGIEYEIHGFQQKIDLEIIQRLNQPLISQETADKVQKTTEERTSKLTDIIAAAIPETANPYLDGNKSHYSQVELLQEYTQTVNEIRNKAEVTPEATQKIANLDLVLCERQFEASPIESIDNIHRARAEARGETRFKPLLTSQAVKDAKIVLLSHLDSGNIQGSYIRGLQVQIRQLQNSLLQSADRELIKLELTKVHHNPLRELFFQKLPTVSKLDLASLTTNGVQRRYSLDIEGFNGFSPVFEAYSKAVCSELREMISQKKNLVEILLHAGIRRHQYAQASNDTTQRFSADMANQGLPREQDLQTPVADFYLQVAEERLKHIPQVASSGSYLFTESNYKNVKVPLTLLLKLKFLSQLENSDSNHQLYWLHTSPEYFEPVLDQLEYLYEQIIRGSLSSSRALPLVSDIHWWQSHLCFFDRGSATVSDWFIDSLAQYKGIQLPAWKRGVAPDVIALSSLRKSFVAIYPNLFIHNPLV